jgi:hypothetical protein
MTIMRCPACGMATVKVAGRVSRRRPTRCEHCGEPMVDDEQLTRSGSDDLELRVRERLYGRRGLGQRPVRR